MTTLGFPSYAIAPPRDSLADAGQYTNAVQVRTSQWDLSIDFLHQYAEGKADDATVSSILVSKLVMSPLHAVALAAILHDAMEQWQATFGALPAINYRQYVTGGALVQTSASPHEDKPQ